MKLIYTFKHLDHSDALQNYAEQRLLEIGRFLLKEGAASVNFSKQKSEFLVEVSINTKEKYFKASSFHFDIYEAVDLVADKLEKQFLKTKSLHKDHKKPALVKERRFEQFLKFKKEA